MLGVPQSIILNSKGDQYFEYYTHEQEIVCANWIYNYAPIDTTIDSDWDGIDRLISQSVLSGSYASSLVEDHKPFANAFFFLRYTGVIDGKLLDSNSQWHNLSEYQNIFDRKDLIYSNGGSSVYW